MTASLVSDTVHWSQINRRALCGIDDGGIGLRLTMNAAKLTCVACSARLAAQSAPADAVPSSSSSAGVSGRGRRGKRPSAGEASATEMAPQVSQAATKVPNNRPNRTKETTDVRSDMPGLPGIDSGLREAPVDTIDTTDGFDGERRPRRADAPSGDRPTNGGDREADGDDPEDHGAAVPGRAEVATAPGVLLGRDDVYAGIRLGRDDAYAVFDGPDEKLFASLGPTAHPSMGDGYRYRYLLGRRWNDNGTLLFIGLNPSVATHLILDPTLSRVMGYAGRERCGGFEVCNLFGWRETKPSLLPELSVAVGVGNDARILAAAARASVILLGWGSHSKGRRRAKDVLELLAPFSEKLHYLKLTKTEQPQHPLYIKKMEPFRRWSERASDPDAPHPNAAKDGGE